MITGDTARLAVRNLRESPLRTTLTVLGVSIGIASLVGMVSFGVALQDQILGNFLRSGVFDAVTVTANPMLPPALRRGQARPPAGERKSQPKLDDDAIKALAAIPKVKEVYPEIRVPTEVKFGTFSELVGTRGVPLSSRGEGVFQSIELGHFFDNDTEPACLVSLDFARRLSDSDPKELLGKDLTLAFATTSNGPDAMPVPGTALAIARVERAYRIVGIIARQAGQGPAAGAFGGLAPVMIPLAQAHEMGGRDLSSPQAILRQLSDQHTYPAVTVKVRHAQDTEEVETAIKALGFTAFSVADVLQGQKKAFILFDILLGLLGSIALTVASLGIVNTVVMSIVERTREIGVMKAIGADDGDVRRIFLAEAALMGLAGGVLGVMLGWVVGRGINIGANYYLQSQGAPPANLFTLTWWLVLGGIAFAMLVGVLAGGFPATRAARLDPVQALRHD